MTVFGTMSAICLCVAALLFSAGGKVRAEEAGTSIGYVKTLSGEAHVLRAGERSPIDVGRPLYEKDVLLTGKHGTLGATLKDNTLLSLGPNSRLELESYLLQPEQDSYSLITKITRGTVLYVSGLIAKLSPESVVIKTNIATLGVRGTRLLVSVDDSDD
jgi:hypothetical protein